MRRLQSTLIWKGALSAVLLLTLTCASAPSALAASRKGAPRKAPVHIGVKSPVRLTSNSAAWWQVTASANPDGTTTGRENVIRGAWALSTSDIWAVGYFQSGPYKALAEHWNGMSWSNVAVPNIGASDNELHAVAADASNDVWAVGYYYSLQDYHTETLTEHWNGVQWTIVPSPNVVASNGVIQDTTLYGVAALASDDVWAVGQYLNGGSGVEITEHWDGAQWTIVPGAVSTVGSSLNAIAAISATNIWAVGGDIEHWNGMQWSVVSSPTPSNGGLMGISALSASNIWAAGAYYDTTAQAERTLVEHWNGTAWTKFLPPNPTGGDDTFYAISAAQDGTVYAVGEADYSTSGTTGLVEIWNGASWAVQTLPALGYSYMFASVAFSLTDAWAMGFCDPSGAYLTLAEHYQPIYALGLPAPK